MPGGVTTMTTTTGTTTTTRAAAAPADSPNGKPLAVTGVRSRTESVTDSGPSCRRCRVCRTPFVPRHRRQKYCGEKCARRVSNGRRRARRKNARNGLPAHVPFVGEPVRVCSQCEEWFEGRSDARTCSDACRQRAYRERRRGAPKTSTREGT
jgi:hypothetical protein